MTVDAVRKLRDAEQHGTVQWLAYDALIVVSGWRDSPCRCDLGHDDSDCAGLRAEQDLIAMDDARKAL